MYLYNFNPCCSGRWSHTYIMIDVTLIGNVLILIVVDNGLVQMIMNILIII